MVVSLLGSQQVDGTRVPAQMQAMQTKTVACVAVTERQGTPSDRLNMFRVCANGDGM
jgi:hypothetical protein